MKLYYILKNIVKNIRSIEFTEAELDYLLSGASTYSSIYTPSDYVIEQGTSGIWTYRKWASGLAECWGDKTFTLSNTGTVWVSPAYYYSLSAVDYPFEFSSVPIEIATPVRSSHNSYWIYKGDGTAADNTTTHTAKYGAIKINSFSNSATVTLSFSVIGTLFDREVSHIIPPTPTPQNLIIPPFENSGTVAGVTYTIDPTTGVTTLNGTSTSALNIDIIAVESREWDNSSNYMLSGCPAEITSDKGSLILELGDYDYGDYFEYKCNGGNSTIVNHHSLYPNSSDITWSLYIYIKSGVTLNNVIFTPTLVKV